MTDAMRMLATPIILIPAYGRRYNTAEDMIRDWGMGKDFKLYGMGCYCSIRDLKALREDSSSITLFDPTTKVESIVG